MDVSREGEYTLIRDLLHADTPKIIVDVGAFGKRNSNSWNFICDDGWQGVLVEPRKRGAELCAEEFAGDFVLLKMAVSNYTGKAKLQTYNKPGWSTLSPRQQEQRLRDTGKTPVRKKAVQVKVTTLPDILARQSIPHRLGVLSIDTESHDEQVISPMLETPWRPDFVLIEQCRHDIMTSHMYRLVLETDSQQIWRYLR